jgi:hypothetical protein
LASFPGLEAQDERPRIEFDQKTFDFGQVLAGKKVTHTYKFRNAGKSDLVIAEVSTSCGCTAALPSKKVVRPGEESGIEVSFDTALRKKLQSKTIKVKSNDPESETVTLVIEGNVIPAVEAEPDYVSFSSSIRRGAGAEQEVRLFSTLKKPFKILEMHSNVPEVVVGEPKPYQKDEEAGYLLKVRLVPEAAPGQYSGKITFRLDHPEMEVFEIMFYGRVWGAVLPEPSYFVYGNVASGQPATKVVTLSKLTPGFKVTTVEIPSEHYKAEVKTVEEGKKLEVHLTVLETMPVGRVSGKVIVKTDLDGEPPVELMVYGRVVGSNK